MIKSKQSDKTVMKMYAIGVVSLVVLALIFSAVAFNKPADAQVASDDSAVSLALSERALDKILGALGFGEEEVAPAIGGTNPDIPSTYLRWGLGQGVRLYPTQSALKTATTTVCAIQSPVATSTLESAGILFTVSSTTASTVTMAKATTAFATTTSLGVATLGAGVQATLVATTTAVNPVDDVTVFAPNTWFVVGMAGGTGDFSPVGTCHATFEEYSI